MFLDKMLEYHTIVEERKQKFRSVEQIKASSKEWEKYHAVANCHICLQPFEAENHLYRRVPDHDHVTGKMMGAAHLICNLQRQGPYLTPIYFHNAQG